jgi:hypothetical protein
MPYCENCGHSLNPTANFCGNCGTPRKQQLPIDQPLPPPPPSFSPESPKMQAQNPQPTTEQILGFIIATKAKRFSNDEYYTGILTNHQLIFAPMTKDMLKEATNITRQLAKSNSNASPIYPYQQRYLASSPSLILAQTQGYITIPNASIREITIKIVTRSDSEGYSVTPEFEMQIKTDMGTQIYHMTKREEYIARLRQVYQDKVKLT